MRDRTRHSRFSMKRTGITALSVLLLSCIMFLASCVPFPHDHRLSPEIVGAVSRNGVPVEGATVYLELFPEDDRCAFSSPHVAVTNSVGRFHFELQSEFSFFIAMDPIDRWQICIEDEDGSYQGWYEHYLGSPMRLMVFDCDLESGMHYELDRYERGSKGICTVSDKK